MGSQPPLLSRLNFVIWLARKEIYWVWAAVLEEQAVSLETESLSSEYGCIE